MPFRSPEAYLKEKIQAVQDYSVLSGTAIASLFSSPRYWADIYIQMDSIGVGSMPIIILTGFFTGCVLEMCIRDRPRSTS